VGNKLGPALVIAAGIFLVYLVLTGKLANLVAAANGTAGAAPASTPGVVGQSSTGGYGSDPSTVGSAAGTQPTLSGAPGGVTGTLAGFGSLANNPSPTAQTTTTSPGAPNAPSYLPEVDASGDLNLAAIDWNQLLSAQQFAGLSAMTIDGSGSPAIDGADEAGSQVGTLAQSIGFTHG
jgi:hypothetical protein